MDQISTQKRILIATLLAFIFFIGYDYLYLSKLQPNENNQTTQISQNNAPITNQNANVAPQKVAKAEKTLVKVSGKLANFEIDEFGRISSFVLNEKKYKTEGENPTQINLINLEQSPLPFEIRFSDSALNDLAFKTPYTANVQNLDISQNEANLILTQNLGDLIVTKNLTFYPNGSYKISVKLSKNVDYFITPGPRPSINVDGYTVHGALIRNADESLKIIEDGDLNGNEFIQNANIAAVSDRYYTAFFYNFENNLNVVVSEDQNEISQVFVKANGEFNAGGFIGPKHHDLLNAIDFRLTDVIEYGWFTFIAKPMFGFLNWLYGFIGNWGWAIVVLTLIIRLVLFPLSYKGMLSMNKMKDLAPQMKELQAKYKSEPQKLQAHMMDLYRKNKVNPMGGCLPILLQIPVFFAIYRVLLNAIELKGAEWAFWIHDLSIKDPYFILPITMGALMFFQQKITPTNFTDPMQEKIMKFLPVIFTFFFLTFPAGLTLYWTINNIASIIQQYVINKIFDAHKKAANAQIKDKK